MSLKRAKQPRKSLVKKPSLSKPRRALERRGKQERRIRSPIDRKFLNFSENDFRAKFKSRGLADSLPYAVISTEGQLEALNARMFYLMGLPEELVLPAEPKDWENFWIFGNEEMAPVRLLQEGITRAFAGNNSSLVADAKLKSYRLLFKPLEEIVGKISGAKNCVIVFAELLRAGDLLQDSESRQSLFRSVAHEIRTSVMALEGMIQMAQGSDDPKPQLDRMQNAVKRLEKVVDRLADLRSSLGLTDSTLTKNAQKIKSRKFGGESK